MASQVISTHYHACNLCEAICGLEIKLQDQQIISIKGDQKDPLSKGHICPKAIALQDIYNDPDRLRLPVKKTVNGWQQISWKQAFDEVASKLKQTQQQYGKNAVAIYQGNPSVHNLDAMIFAPMFVRSLRTKNKFSATSVDQLPEQLVSLLMFGHSLMVPLPDLDRTDFLIIFGANPVVSNGSLMTAPGVQKRLKKIQQGGGKFIVVDPRKTETALIADQHLFIKPGTDVFMLLAMLGVVFSENLQTLGSVAAFTHDLQIIEALVKHYTPETVAPITGVDAEQLKSLVRDFCTAKKATCYGRIGVSTQQYGTLTQWLITVFNIVTGNLDIAGGTMFSRPAFEVLEHRSGRRKGFADDYSRVRKLPNFAGEFPVATLAEEITTAGKDQIRSLITHAGNPVLSTPNGKQIDKALENLDFMVSIDFYINETTRHADIILPPLSILERPHYDVVFHALAIQNTSRYSVPVFKANKKHRSGAAIFLELTWRMQSDNWWSKFTGWVKKSILQRLDSNWIVDMKLKKGAYGKSHGLNLKHLKDNPHGIDLGPMMPCLPERLFTVGQKINLAPEEFVAGIERLNEHLLAVELPIKDTGFDMLLIGRRDPRTNNSWLHNSYRMVKGKNRCLALLHINDAASRNIEEGEVITVKSRVGEITIPVSLTEDMMPGVISIPHGWGHNVEGANLNIAKSHAGVNTNILTDDKLLDGISGNAVLNGIPVAVTKLSSSLN